MDCNVLHTHTHTPHTYKKKFINDLDLHRKSEIIILESFR